MTAYSTTCDWTSEKKARKSLSKLGLKRVEGITRVVMRRPKNVRSRRG